jgi:iron(III) transport system substrate-binding protein
VIILNTNKVKAPYPNSLTSLLDPKFKDQGSLARPLNGTTATHAAVLWAKWGPEGMKRFFQGLEGNGVRICAGNAHVMREVSAGNTPWGFTDTDDFHVALLDKKPVDLVFPDGDGEGTLLIPNTVCQIKGGPNPENAKKLIDFILSREVETILAKGRSAQIPVREGIPQPTGLKGLDKMKVMKVDWAKVGEAFAPSHDWLKEFVRGK